MLLKLRVCLILAAVAAMAQAAPQAPAGTTAAPAAPAAGTGTTPCTRGKRDTAQVQVSEDGKQSQSQSQSGGGSSQMMQMSSGPNGTIMTSSGGAVSPKPPNAKGPAPANLTANARTKRDASGSMDMMCSKLKDILVIFGVTDKTVPKINTLLEDYCKHTKALMDALTEFFDKSPAWASLMGRPAPPA